MFKLAKSVLTAVSNDPALFKKEYFKFIQWMPPGEVKTLTMWCVQTFDVDLLSIIGIT